MTASGDYKEFEQAVPSFYTELECYENTHLSASDAQVTLKDLYRELERECPWPDQSHFHCSPFPIFLSRSTIAKMGDVAEALSNSISSIIDRWWSESSSELRNIIPLDPKATELLRWLDEPEQRAARPYHRNLGFWRPDFVLEDIHPESSGQQEKPDWPIKICEINARYACNGFIMGAHVDRYTRRNLGAGHVSAYTPKLDDVYKSTFNRGKKLFIVRGNVKGLDINMLKPYLEQHDVCAARFIAPSDLVLHGVEQKHNERALKVSVPDTDCKRCKGSCCKVLETVEQAVLEVAQAELLSLPSEILKVLALVATNDMRTIFLAHDKRMLGIILQELPRLVTVENIISHSQANLLRQTLLPTISPGTPQMVHILEEFRKGEHSKDDWILKPVGGGKGHGIVFGHEVASEAEWLSLMERNQGTTQSAANLETGLCALQPYVRQPRHDLVVAQDGTSGWHLARKRSMFLVGTMMMAAGRYIGTTVWRANTDPICAVLRGGNWFAAVTNL
ncbi:hypothetical protein DM02DRAFT_541389 [Periconia macrospinosa]|uniref:Glutathione synthetase ATP-binding domain-like protein n=1 Tax=Periconia macrospinosa TaxID=97972 RepID=A0A2V1D618_9PLEO|nr:hypothetical protein DM02DRAFT_541389 [Periconia macrospinosa]